MKNQFTSNINNLSTQKSKSNSLPMRINQNDTHFTRSVGTHCDIYAEAAIYGYEPEDVDSGEYTVPFTNRDSYHEKVRKESGLSVQKYNAIQALVNRRMIEKDWSF